MLTRHLYRFGAIALFGASAMIPGRAAAQLGVTVWAGAGSSSPDGNTQFERGARQAGLQLGLPLIPIAIRGDALLFGSKFDQDALSYTVSAIVRIPLPIIQPYAIAGKGRYALSLTEKKDGLSYGGGVRVGLGRLGVFGEARRHEALGRTVTVIGVTF